MVFLEPHTERGDGLTCDDFSLRSGSCCRRWLWRVVASRSSFGLARSLKLSISAPAWALTRAARRGFPPHVESNRRLHRHNVSASKVTDGGQPGGAEPPMPGAHPSATVP